MVADLSKRLVAITTGFAGTDVLLFGAVRGKGEIVVDQDEYIREGVEIDQIAKLRPAFDKEGTVTV